MVLVAPHDPHARAESSDTCQRPNYGVTGSFCGPYSGRERTQQRRDRQSRSRFVTAVSQATPTAESRVLPGSTSCAEWQCPAAMIVYDDLFPGRGLAVSGSEISLGEIEPDRLFDVGPRFFLVSPAEAHPGSSGQTAEKLLVSASNSSTMRNLIVSLCAFRNLIILRPLRSTRPIAPRERRSRAIHSTPGWLRPPEGRVE